MKKSELIGIALSVLLVFLSGNPLSAVITPTDPWQSQGLGDPSPVPFTWNSSIAYYNNQLIYAGSDKKIYAFDIAGGTSVMVSDTSALSDPWASVSGFLVTSDHYLYFHDNRFPTGKIFRLLFAAI